MSNNKPQSYPPGSDEDIKLTNEILTKFWMEKLKSIELYRATGTMPSSTNNTSSICHVDGTTDCD